MEKRSMASTMVLTPSCQVLFGCTPGEAEALLPRLSFGEVHKAFKRQAFQYHPEVINELPEAFQKLRKKRFMDLTEAYMKLRKHFAPPAAAAKQPISKLQHLPGKKATHEENIAVTPAALPTDLSPADPPIDQWPMDQWIDQLATRAATPAKARAIHFPDFGPDLGLDLAPGLGNKQTADLVERLETTDGQDAPPRIQPRIQLGQFSTEKTTPTLLAIGGGKGGTGKSTLAVNLAIALARAGRSVVLADTDLGSADAHVLLGMKRPDSTLHDAVAAVKRDGNGTAFANALEATPFLGVHLLAGCSEKLGNANLTSSNREAVIEGLRGLPAEVVILDLSGNTAYHALDFFLAADLGLVVTTTEPASILDTYHFLKVCALRRVQRYLDERPARRDIIAQMRQLFLKANRDGMAIPELLREMIKLHPKYAQGLRTTMKRLRIFSVINMRRQANADRVAENLRGVCQRMAGLDVSYLGTIPNDLAVVKSTRELRPVLTAYPLSSASLAMQQIAAELPFNPSDQTASAALAS